MINLDWLRRLIRLVEESDIDSLEIERLTTRVRIRKSPPGPGVTAQVSPAAQPHSPVSAPATPAPGVEPPPASATDGLAEVRSPMVGTFYRSPSPDMDPFVSVGDHVEKGQTLCILEAMKLMNELPSDAGGVIAEITVQNGDPVEFGQLLFRIDPD